jgi:hypothetical protein
MHGQFQIDQLSHNRVFKYNRLWNFNVAGTHLGPSTAPLCLEWNRHSIEVEGGIFR